ncbi:hypothetical protein PMZ80_008570 [Knufia obscura]|uniref:Uncharacterized protein n=2 Tax=Knufia TaxID=430999 RepID=A0AAN8I6M0_9EURO|nr:hypothetical protein PMZ80_008570 [Knufia obscura]KAK5952026.1 hypothetical protein OHC33_006912 [Knufia fluminis]
MARKKRQRISYVLPLATRPGGHRLGVNGLSIDHDRNILYTGGRDGSICAWDLDHEAKAQEQEDNSLPRRRTTASFRREVQAHTHWVNDLVLVKNNLALVSASSDSSVKLWRPHSHDAIAAYSIGSHSDYVKCLTSPGSNSDWIASGGLDHRICLWDLSGKGQKLEINVSKAANVAKGSVYALKANRNMIASGGPESVVRLWDINSGKSITKLVGHTDNIRDILISEDGDAVLTASSDQTIKVWSVTAGRCMHTLTMHNDSVWCMYSEDPSLSIFYSGDKSGLVAKTDLRHADDIDEAVSVAVCQEHDGINRLAVAGDSVWTSTSSSSVNRWQDVDTELEIETPPASPQQERSSSVMSKSIREQSPPAPATNGHDDNAQNGNTQKKIPHNAILRVTNTALHPGMKASRDPNMSSTNLRKASEAIVDPDMTFTMPMRGHPEETIEGQNGLVKHVMLNDKKRVLTLDAAGEVVLWDLLKCIPIQSFGRRHLDDVLPSLNTAENVNNWCTVDTKTGKLTVMLEEIYCFDAEVYADETEFAGKIDFREDQRINLGKWVLRNLFTTLLDEEIRRDEEYRKSIKRPTGMKRENAPTGLTLPLSTPASGVNTPGDMTTPKASNGLIAPKTPGMNIGLATPQQPGKTPTQMTNPLPPTVEEGEELSKTSSRSSHHSSSARSSDYFSQTKLVTTDTANGQDQKDVPPTPGGTVHSPLPQSPMTDEKKKKSGLFGKGFNMKMSFPNKLARTSTEVSKGPGEDAKKEDEKKSEGEDNSDKSSEKEEPEKPARIVEDNFYGTIQRIRFAYQDHLEDPATADQPIPIGITPSSPNETPILKPPPHTMVLIQQDDPDSGGLSDLYRGEIATLGNPKETDTLEKIAPSWLGELLLRNEIPPKDIAKVSFILMPHPDSKWPGIASSDGNARLNANRMLRSKKILGYVSERIEAPPDPENPRLGDELKPEEYMDLICQGQVVPPDMTLATLRVHMWRTGGDVVLHYKENGKREFKRAHPVDAMVKGDGTSEMVKSANDNTTAAQAAEAAAAAERERELVPPNPFPAESLVTYYLDLLYRERLPPDDFLERISGLSDDLYDQITDLYQSHENAVFAQWSKKNGGRGTYEGDPPVWDVWMPGMSLEELEEELRKVTDAWQQ